MDLGHRRRFLIASGMFFIAALDACSALRIPQGTELVNEPPDDGALPLSDAVEHQAILSAMTVVAEGQLAVPSIHKPYEWQVAPFWVGLYELALLSRDRQKYLNTISYSGESIDWKPGPRVFNADDLAVTQIFFLLFWLEHDRRMIEPTLARFEGMLQASFSESPTFSNDKTAREWVWCDALFMAPPALALAARTTGEDRYARLMDRLWWKTTDYLYDREERMYFRDSRYFNRREPNGKKVFWSRGNGWVLAGLARVLKYLPADYSGRQRFVTLFQQMAESIAGLQGHDGYWRASLLDPNSWPMPETSGTGFFTFALAWGVNEGLLGPQYQPSVRRGWSAMVRAIQPSGRLGFVQREASEPSATGPDHTAIYGSGAFLLAGSEVYRLAVS